MKIDREKYQYLDGEELKEFYNQLTEIEQKALYEVIHHREIDSTLDALDEFEETIQETSDSIDELVSKQDELKTGLHNLKKTITDR